MLTITAGNPNRKPLSCDIIVLPMFLESTMNGDKITLVKYIVSNAIFKSEISISPIDWLKYFSAMSLFWADQWDPTEPCTTFVF